MTLGEVIFEKMQKQKPFHDRIEQVFAHQDGIRVRCEMSEANRLGCALTHLEVAKDTRAVVEMPELAKRLDGLCEQVTYLLEPLQTIEVDRQANAVLVRSREPRRRPDGVSYYELIADNALHVSLRRYSYSPAEKKRNPVPFVLTNDQLEMLLNDLQHTVVDAAKN
jgi:hypothetical protein